MGIFRGLMYTKWQVGVEGEFHKEGKSLADHPLLIIIVRILR